MTGMSVIERIATEKAGEVERAKLDYPGLLLRFSRPQDGDVEKVQAVCGLLGVGLDQYERDAKVAEQVPRLLESIAAAEEHRAELKKLAAAKLKRITPDRLANPKARKKYDDAMRQTTRLQGKHAAGCRKADHAAEQLKELRERHWWGDEIIALVQEEPAKK